MNNQFPQFVTPYSRHAQQSTYRPQYQPKAKNPSHVLDNAPASKEAQENLFKPLLAIEEWRQGEEQDKHFVRWHPEMVTSLGIFVEPPPNKAWANLVVKASKEWEAASSGNVKFWTTASKSRAHIIIEWTEEPIEGREFEVGHTNRAIQPPNWITKATITLLKQPAIDAHLTPAQIQGRVYATILHELGHALGLEHSENTKDVMHHQGWKNMHVSPNDIKHLDALYSQPARLIWL